MSMNSKERVMCAVGLGEPDRMPLDMHPNPFVAERLMKEWGLSEYCDLLLRMGSDMVDLRSVVNPTYCGPVPYLKEYPDGLRENFWGWRTRIEETACGPEEIYAEFVLAEAETVEELEKHRWPSVDWFDFSDFSERLEPWRDFAVMASGPSIWQHPTFLRSLEQMLMDLLSEPELAEYMMDRFTDFYVAFFDRMFSAAPGKIDLMRIADDVGTQQGLLFSPEVFDRFFVPRITRLVKMAHSHGVKVMFHSCGAILSLIDSIAACGVDVLDPLQVTAKGMEPEVIKKRFGTKMCLHGGVDTQHLLPHGTPEEVWRRTRELMEIFGKGGGYIAAPSHVLQMDVPPANIEALRNAVFEG